MYLGHNELKLGIKILILFFLAEHDIFGEVSSSEDEEDKDVNIMDSGEDDSTLKVDADDSLMAIKDDSVLGAELNAEAG